MLDKEIDRLAEVVDKMTTRPLGRQNLQNRPYKAYIWREREEEVTESMPLMTEVEEILDYDRNGRGYSLFRGRSRGYNNLRASHKGQYSYTDRGENRQQKFESPSRSPATGTRVASRSPTEIKIDFSVRDNLVILLKNVLRSTHLQAKCSRDERIPRHKGFSHLYGGDPKEEYEAIMAAMCHSTETYSSMQVQREDDEYTKQVNK